VTAINSLLGAIFLVWDTGGRKQLFSLHCFSPCRQSVWEDMLRQYVNMGEGGIPSGLLPFICWCHFRNTFLLRVILVDGFANPSEGGLERSSDKPFVFSCCVILTQWQNLSKWQLKNRWWQLSFESRVTQQNLKPTSFYRTRKTMFSYMSTFFSHRFSKACWTHLATEEFSKEKLQDNCKMIEILKKPKRRSH